MNSLRRFFCSIYADQCAQTIILFAVTLPVLFAFAAIAVDIGILRYQQEQLQTAADAAALASAIETNYCASADCSAMQTAALHAMKENGYADVTLLKQCTGTPSNTDTTLMLNNGPCEVASDPNFGNKGYVEAVVSKPESTFFARVLGIDTATASARAEAHLGTSKNCVFISTANTGSVSSALRMTGGNLSASCGVTVDSSASDSADLNYGATLSATQVNLHGGKTGEGVISPTPNTYSPSVPDPFSYLTPPASTPCTYTSLYTVSYSTNKTLEPGNYCGGIYIDGGYSVTFAPGTYTIANSFTIGGDDVVSGNGVTFYLSSGAFTMKGSTVANLTAPTTGPYAGILLYQNPLDTNTATLYGGTDSAFVGTFYLPGATLQLNGSSNTSTSYTLIDAAKIYEEGGANFIIGDNYSSLPGGSPAKSPNAVLSE